MGLSEPLDESNRALIRRFSHLVDDGTMYLDKLLLPALAARGIKAPIFMGGNSLGGLVASYMVLERPDVFKGLVMQSPGGLDCGATQIGYAAQCKHKRLVWYTMRK